MDGRRPSQDRGQTGPCCGRSRCHFRGRWKLRLATSHCVTVTLSPSNGKTFPFTGADLRKCHRTWPRFSPKQKGEDQTQWQWVGTGREAGWEVFQWNIRSYRCSGNSSWCLQNFRHKTPFSEESWCGIKTGVHRASLVGRGGGEGDEGRTGEHPVLKMLKLS